MDLLNADNKTEIIIDFKDAQKFANGLTNGWHEFNLAFEKFLIVNRQVKSEGNKYKLQSFY